MPLLEVVDLHAGYGAVPVLHGVNISIEEGETHVMLGLNGAGKTTTLISIAGLLKPKGGQILFDGKAVGGKDARHMVKLGLILIPEGRHVFPGLSVYNNLRLGAWARRRERKLFKKNVRFAFDLFPRLEERRNQMAGTLSGGEQQMLAIARGMMSAPRLLLIDEASLGLSPKLAHEVFMATRRINAEGVTVFMVEQNAGILRHVDKALIMEKGRIKYEGAGRDILEAGDLRSAYLGA